MGNSILHDLKKAEMLILTVHGEASEERSGLQLKASSRF